MGRLTDDSPGATGGDTGVRKGLAGAPLSLVTVQAGRARIVLAVLQVQRVITNY